jgi:hypothetical protein
MHTADLGTSQYLAANVLLDLFHRFGGLVTRPDATCADLLLLINFHAKRLGRAPPLGALTLTMFKPKGGPPVLRAKAAETRQLVLVLREVLAQLPQETPTDTVRWHAVNYAQPSDALRGQTQKGPRLAGVVSQLAFGGWGEPRGRWGWAGTRVGAEAWQMYEELLRWREGSQHRAGEAACRFVLMYSEMGRIHHALDPQTLRWRFFPKFHLLLHCLEYATDNAADAWCYADEDQIGQASELATSCHARTVGRSVMEKYRATQLRSD